MGVFEETFNPMWVFDGYTIGTLPDVVDPEIIDVISAPNEVGIGSSFEWSLEKMGIRRVFGIISTILSTADQKAREKIVVTEYLKYIEEQKEKGINADFRLVSECCFDMIVSSYLSAMNRIHRKNKTVPALFSAATKGTYKWIKGFFNGEKDNNLFGHVGEEAQNNYEFVNSVLFRRSYAFLTNCFAVGKFISEEEYQQLCSKYLFNHRASYLKIEAPSGHPVFNKMSLRNIAHNTENGEFARQVVEYYENKYSSLNWLTQVSQSQMNYFAENRVFADDYLV